MRATQSHDRMKEAQDEKLTVTHSDGESLVVELNLADGYDLHEELAEGSA